MILNNFDDLLKEAARLADKKVKKQLTPVQYFFYHYRYWFIFTIAIPLGLVSLYLSLSPNFYNPEFTQTELFLKFWKQYIISALFFGLMTVVCSIFEIIDFIKNWGK